MSCILKYPFVLDLNTKVLDFVRSGFYYIINNKYRYLLFIIPIYFSIILI